MHEHGVDPRAGVSSPPEYDGEDRDVADGREHEQDGVEDDGDDVAGIEPHVDGDLIAGEVAPIGEEAEGGDVVGGGPHLHLYVLISWRFHLQQQRM